MLDAKTLLLKTTHKQHCQKQQTYRMKMAIHFKMQVHIDKKPYHRIRLYKCNIIIKTIIVQSYFKQYFSYIMYLLFIEKSNKCSTRKIPTMKYNIYLLFQILNIQHDVLRNNKKIKKRNKQTTSFIIMLLFYLIMYFIHDRFQ